MCFSLFRTVRILFQKVCFPWVVLYSFCMRNMAILMLASSIFLVSADCGGLPLPNLVVNRVAWNGVWSNQASFADLGTVELTLTEAPLGQLAFSISGTAKLGAEKFSVSGRENLPLNTSCNAQGVCFIMGYGGSQVLLDFFDSSNKRAYQFDGLRPITQLVDSKRVSGTFQSLNGVPIIKGQLDLTLQ